MTHIFNYEKYCDWRVKYDKLTRKELILLNNFTDYSKFNGLTREDIQSKGYIILKRWCDEKES